MSSLAPRPLHTSLVPASPSKKTHRPWIWSLTGICFLFGGLMAMQLRAVEQSHQNLVLKQKGTQDQADLLLKMQAKAKEDAAKSAHLQAQLSAWKKNTKGYVSPSMVKQLNTQLQDLRLVAGLTPVVGQGVTITLTDNPQAAQAGGGAFLPGIVHDFDLQQTVHELLSAKAEAVAVKGAGGGWIRITGYTPIRCVGPTIYVNFKSCAAPFTIAAIGNPITLKNALETPGGIIYNLKQQTLGVKIVASRSLKLPAMEGVPTFSDAKSVEENARIAAR